MTAQAELDKLPALQHLQREVDKVTLEVEQLESQVTTLAAQEKVRQAEAADLRNEDKGCSGKR